MSSIAHLFGETGPLALSINGYRPRQQQIKIAEQVDHAIKKSEKLVIEAGTGIGKTYAYLAPVLTNNKKVIVSTGSKALQEQLFHRDLPTLLKATQSSKKVALLKGRSNYLCPQRLSQHLAHVPTDDSDVMHQLAQVAKFATETKTGDMADITGLEEDAKVLPYVTSTADNCLGNTCPEFEQCYIRRARLRALEADLVVVNHHLFFADVAVKESGFAELIPTADAYIFDEAHQLIEIASDYFGESIGSRAFYDLIKDIRVEYRSHFFDVIQCGKGLDRMEAAVRDFRLLFAIDPDKGDWSKKSQTPEVNQGIQRILREIDFVYQVLKMCLDRSDTLEPLFERLISIKGKFERLADTTILGYSYWFETTRNHFNLHLTPLDISKKFSDLIEQSTAAWVFTSATLAVHGRLEHFTEGLGIKEATTSIIDSPFDYYNQAYLCMPRYLPESHSDHMGHSIIQLSKKIIRASKGRCFLLFTSYRMLEIVAEGLMSDPEYPLLIQGQSSKRILLEKFIRHGNSVLLGTASFWEGVDVRGKALSCVIIDKLPFVSPDDPLLQARIQDCRLRGGDPFYQVQLPQAVIALKQGVGRLIRDPQDQGALIICDNRLLTRHYGEIFLSSLPNMRRTRDINKVTQFLEKIE